MSDTFAPDGGQTVGPNGEILYDFRGHVHAEGLDLDAVTSATAPDDSKIRWIRQSDGAVTAELWSGTDGTRIFAHSEDGGGLPGAAIYLTANYDSGPELDAVGVLAGGNGGAYRTLIQEDGSSDFVQLAETSTVKLEGPFQDSVYCDAGDDTTITFSCDQPFTNFATVSGGTFDIGQGYHNWFTWGWKCPTTTSYEITFHNHSDTGVTVGFGFLVHHD